MLHKYANACTSKRKPASQTPTYSRTKLWQKINKSSFWKLISEYLSVYCVIAKFTRQLWQRKGGIGGEWGWEWRWGWAFFERFHFIVFTRLAGQISWLYAGQISWLYAGQISGWSDILIARDNPRAVQREFLVINQSTEPKNQRSIIRTLGLAAHSFSSSLEVWARVEKQIWLRLLELAYG